MEDTRLPDSETRKRCPTCDGYSWMMPNGSRFACNRCTPHCLQVGHTANGAIVSENECERKSEHPKPLDFDAVFAKRGAAEAAASKR